LDRRRGGETHLGDPAQHESVERVGKAGVVRGRVV
jgi:hypothetical protein